MRTGLESAVPIRARLAKMSRFRLLDRMRPFV